MKRKSRCVEESHGKVVGKKSEKCLNEVEPATIESIFASKKIESRESRGSKQRKEVPRKTSAKRVRTFSQERHSMSAKEWTDDGLGGRFNREGFTGRVDKDGIKIFKAHVLNGPDAGTTKKCPFDCDCCFI